MLEINSYLQNLSKQLSFSENEREKINTSYNYLEGKLYEHFRDKIHKVSIFGSYDRGTALPQNIDSESDIDVMIVFKTNQFQPDTILKHLRDFADKIYSRSEVWPDHPAVTVVLQHTKFELVPAYIQEFLFSSNELKIPAPKNKELKWITTNPDTLKEKLLEKDQKENGMIIPLVRLMKYLNVLNQRPYESFRFELQAIESRYRAAQSKDYFLEYIRNMYTNDQTELQKKFILSLKSKRENILHLLERDMHEYVIQELEKFIPLQLQS